MSPEQGAKVWKLDFMSGLFECAGWGKLSQLCIKKFSCSTCNNVPFVFDFMKDTCHFKSGICIYVWCFALCGKPRTLMSCVKLCFDHFIHVVFVLYVAFSLLFSVLECIKWNSISHSKHAFKIYAMSTFLCMFYVPHVSFFPPLFPLRNFDPLFIFRFRKCKLWVISDMTFPVG